jgi:hypothetical protein
MIGADMYGNSFICCLCEQEIKGRQENRQEKAQVLET